MFMMLAMLDCYTREKDQVQTRSTLITCTYDNRKRRL